MHNLLRIKDNHKINPETPNLKGMILEGYTDNKAHTQ